MAKRAPCVDMRTDVHKDERFACLADVAGFAGGRYEAIGRMHALYSWCVDRKLKDAPDESDGYVVSAAVVCRFLGPSGVRALTADGCDELALGREFEPGRYYLRGTGEYVSAMRGLNRFAVAGGVGRLNGAVRINGKFVADPTITPAVSQPQTSREPAVNQPSASHESAVASVLPLTSYLLPKEEERESGKPDVLALTPVSPAQVLAEVAVAEINRLSGSRYTATSKSVVDDCKALAKDKRTPEQVKAVVAFKATKWVGCPKMGEQFKPSVLLRRSNFTKYLDDMNAAPSTRAAAVRMSAPDDDEPRLDHLLMLGNPS